MKSAIVLVVLIAALALGDAFVNSSKQTLTRKRRFLGNLINGSINILSRSTTASPATTTVAQPSQEAETISVNTNGTANESLECEVEDLESADQNNSGNSNNSNGLGIGVDLGLLGGINAGVGANSSGLNIDLNIIGLNASLGISHENGIGISASLGK